MSGGRRDRHARGASLGGFESGFSALSLGGDDEAEPLLLSSAAFPAAAAPVRGSFLNQLNLGELAEHLAQCRSPSPSSPLAPRRGLPVSDGARVSPVASACAVATRKMRCHPVLPRLSSSSSDSDAAAVPGTPASDGKIHAPHQSAQLDVVDNIPPAAVQPRKAITPPPPRLATTLFDVELGFKRDGAAAPVQDAVSPPSRK